MGPRSSTGRSGQAACALPSAKAVAAPSGRAQVKNDAPAIWPRYGRMDVGSSELPSPWEVSFNYARCFVASISSGARLCLVMFSKTWAGPRPAPRMPLMQIGLRMPTTSPSVGWCARLERAEMTNLWIGGELPGWHSPVRTADRARQGPLSQCARGAGPDDLPEFFSQAHIVPDPFLARLKTRIGFRVSWALSASIRLDQNLSGTERWTEIDGRRRRLRRNIATTPRAIMDRS